MANETEEQKAAITTERGRLASKISDSDERKSFIAGSGNVDKHYQDTAEDTAAQSKKQQMKEILGSQYQVARDARKNG